MPVWGNFESDNPGTVIISISQLPQLQQETLWTPEQTDLKHQLSQLPPKPVIADGWVWTQYFSLILDCNPSAKWKIPFSWWKKSGFLFHHSKERVCHYLKDIFHFSGLITWLAQKDSKKTERSLFTLNLSEINLNKVKLHIVRRDCSISSEISIPEQYYAPKSYF